MDSPTRNILNSLERTLSPFDNFVAKSDLEEEGQLATNRHYLMQKLEKSLSFKTQWKIIPITGKTGQGKTFLCWKIKDSLKIKGYPIFMDVSPNPKLFFYDLYTNIIEELGVSRLREITRKISDRWGASEMKYGLFRTSNTAKILGRASDSMRYRWSHHKTELRDCMKIIIGHAMDPEKFTLAERWLLGEIMDSEELLFLGVDHNLSDSYMAEEMLKIIVDYVDEGVILIYDDIDVNWNNFTSTDNWEADWADSLDQDPKSNSSFSAEHNFFNMLITLMKYTRSIKIVITMHPKNQKFVLSHFPDQLKFLIHKPLPIIDLSTRDTKKLYLEIMSDYLREHQLTPSENQFFPLSEKLIMQVFLQTYGNPRETIKEFQKLFDKIIFEQYDTSKLEQEYPFG